MFNSLLWFISVGGFLGLRFVAALMVVCLVCEPIAGLVVSAHGCRDDYEHVDL